MELKASEAQQAWIVCPSIYIRSAWLPTTSVCMSIPQCKGQIHKKIVGALWSLNMCRRTLRKGEIVEALKKVCKQTKPTFRRIAVSQSQCCCAHI